MEDKLLSEIRFNVRKHFEDTDLPTKDGVEQYTSSLLMFCLDFSGDYNELRDSLDAKAREALVTKLVDQYWKEQSIRQGGGAFLTDGAVDPKWLQEVEEDISWYYWGNYRRYLEVEQGWSKDVVSTIGKDSREILSLAGNPHADNPFHSKGLVVGNVQSGKTANYLGLMCRAADAGYRYIVVLAATTNDLREQTQKRIEEGFIGIDCSSLVGGAPTRVGVGKLQEGDERHPNPGTTRASDFSTQKMKALLQISANAGTMPQPWVFVIKKNTHTLKNLIGWLRSNPANLENGQLLLIDDEADYASINTKASKADISRVNQQIRELLAVFPTSAYVGYTATPFANILIDKDAQDEKVGSDIFPKDFIYTLCAADSYFGAAKVFGDIVPEDEQIEVRPKHVRFIEDSYLIPPNAKDYELDDLPGSMYEAIRTFLLASTIRIMRKEADTHTSMLINISHLNIVQKKLAAQVNDYVEECLKPAFKMYGGMSANSAEQRSSEIAEIHSVWNREFAGNAGFTWEQVFSNMRSATIRPLKVAIINSKSGDSLDYQHNIEHVIAVGGYRLSRGLTLEGLIVSYFSRNSRAYDTLMQMSRWFGHRVGYEDICRVWMTEESAGWCRFVADATEELTYDLLTMQRQHKTPLEFGQRVRAHPGSLMVTARNKMGTGTIVEDVSLNGRAVETSVLKRSEASLENNRSAAFRLITSLEESHVTHELWEGAKKLLPDAEGGDGGYGPLFRDVPASLIVKFIRSFDNSDASRLSATDPVIEQISYCTDEGKDQWDVMFAARRSSKSNTLGASPTFDCCGDTYLMQRRSPGNRTDEEVIYIGNRSKVSTRGIDSVGLSASDLEDVKKTRTKLEEAGFHPSVDYLYRKHRKNPLLVVHLLDLKFKSPSDYENARRGSDRTGKLSAAAWGGPDYEIQNAVAWTISFPPLQKDRHVRYVYNQVMLDQLEGLDEYDEDTDDFDEQD